MTGISDNISRYIIIAVRAGRRRLAARLSIF
jgi:hypothetical protein